MLNERISILTALTHSFQKVIFMSVFPFKEVNSAPGMQLYKNF